MSFSIYMRVMNIPRQHGEHRWEWQTIIHDKSACLAKGTGIGKIGGDSEAYVCGQPLNARPKISSRLHRTSPNLDSYWHRGFLRHFDFLRLRWSQEVIQFRTFERFLANQLSRDPFHRRAPRR